MMNPWGALGTSMGIVVITMVLAIVLLIKGSGSLEFKQRTKGYVLSALITGVVLAICMLNLAFEIYTGLQEGAVKVSGWERFASSLLKTAKAVGVDENLDKFILDLRAMMAVIAANQSCLQNAIGVYASILYVIAPILGGIGLLEILAGIFPRVQLFFLGLYPWKQKYYFSQLNDGTLALARSICRVKMCWLLRPVLIFTNVEPGNDETGNMQRVNEAKAIGAICLHTDLKNTPKAWLGKRKYLLLEEDESRILQQLSMMSSLEKRRKLKSAEVFFAVFSDAYEPVEKRIQKELRSVYDNNKLKKKCDRLEEKYKQMQKQCQQLEENCKKQLDETGVEAVDCRRKCMKMHLACAKQKKAWEKKLAQWESENPIFTTVRTNFNLVMNLLTEIPLFEPLIGKKKKPDGSRDLVVSILGAGGLGMEMFLNTYWIGQMLDCNLTVNVYSQEEKEDFEARLDHINPDILETTRRESEILHIDRDGKRSAQPYCKVNYTQCILGSGDLKQIATGIEASDYCFVALGSDMENIDIANRVYRCVGEHHITQEDLRTVIAYVVYDPQVAELLNRENRYRHIAEKKADVYMQAVGTLEEVYSVKNVFMPDVETAANATYNDYKALQDKTKRIKENKTRFKKTEYDCRANIARVMHNAYKQYSTGMLTVSLFDVETVEALAQQREREAKAAMKLLQADPSGSNLTKEEYEKLLHRISWLEHRRWNAFTRIMGYRSTKLCSTYYPRELSHKQVPLRLHPCLVECDDKGIRCGLDGEHYPQVMELTYLKNADRDLLDDLSYEVYKMISALKEKAAAPDSLFTDAEKEKIKSLTGYDFKFYDYFATEKPKK